MNTNNSQELLLTTRRKGVSAVGPSDGLGREQMLNKSAVDKKEFLEQSVGIPSTKSLELEEMDRLTAAWKKAKPSQINDSFTRVSNGYTQRACVFMISRAKLKHLFQEDVYGLELHYGLKDNCPEDQFAFTPIIKTLDANSLPLAMFAFEALDFQNQDIPAKVVMELQQKHGIGQDICLNLNDVSDELISPVTAQWMFKKWQMCKSSELVDQVETYYQDVRLRLEHSHFDHKVVRFFKDQMTNDSDLYLHLGIHDVIPGDPRIFHFAPILKVFNGLNSEGNINIINFELTFPCPPCEWYDD